MDCYLCRCADCNATFKQKYNRNKHERKTGHYKEEPSENVVPHDSMTKLYRCRKLLCTFASKKKANAVRHIKSCYEISR